MQGPQVRSEHWGREVERLGIQEEALACPFSQSLGQQEPRDLSGDRVGVVEHGSLSSRANSGNQVPLSSSRTVCSLQGQPLPCLNSLTGLSELPPWHLDGQRGAQDLHTKRLLGHWQNEFAWDSSWKSWTQGLTVSVTAQPALARLQYNSGRHPPTCRLCTCVSFCGQAYPCIHISTYVLALMWCTQLYVCTCM